MELTETQFHRYARHLILDEVGDEGQEKLLESRVLVVGAAGLGSPGLMYLAAAGGATLRPVGDDTGGLTKQEAQAYLQRGIRGLAAMQDKLYAQDQWGVLLVFQAMDAAGKDGTIKHVMSGINPQGCQVSSFKAPSGRLLIGGAFVLQHCHWCAP